MKNIIYIAFIALLFISCKQKAETKIVKAELSIAEKIANAHGFENWKNVSEIKFTFQVDRDSIKGNGRSWIWQPKTDKITMSSGQNITSYSRNKMDSLNVKTDRSFINDKFWLLVPFQLVWDTSATISEANKAEAPISKKELNKITLTYPNDGGYTPGDAYDIFYDNAFIIKEWVYRKGNSATPSLTTTFENIKDYNGIKIATDHKQAGGKWNLNFTNVSITLDE